MIKDHTEGNAKFVTDKYDRFGKQFLQVCIKSKMTWVSGERCVFRRSVPTSPKCGYDSAAPQPSASKPTEAHPHQSSSTARFKPARNFKPGKPVAPAASVDIDLS